MAYQIYKDASNEWRWRFVSGNNKIIAVSSESYVNKADCQASIELLKKSSEESVEEH